MADNLIRNRLTKKFTSLSLDKEDLKKVLILLQERANTAAEIEFNKLEKRNLENITDIKADLDICAVLKITIKGDKNEELFGTIDEVFNSNSFPENVLSIYLNSVLNYTTLYKYNPENSFMFYLDFTTPKLFDFSFQPSERTPNESTFEVQGSNNLWVNGVFLEVNSFIDFKPSKFSKIHKGSIYDLLLWFFGFPFAFSICHSFINLKLSFIEQNSFLENIILTYLFLLSLFIIRITFHYFRWVYPMIEFKNKNGRSIKHQAALLSISLGIMGKLLYDIVKFFLLRD